MQATFTTWQEAEESYDEILDQSGMVGIGSLSYAPSQVLRAVDPIAYRTGLLDYVDAEGIDSDDLEGEPSV